MAMAPEPGHEPVSRRGVQALFLTNRLVEDPPELAQKRSSGIKIDYIGLALVGIGLGCLQVVLDKGQRADWLHSDFIVAFSVIA